MQNIIIVSPVYQYLKNLVRNSADLFRCSKLYDRIFTTTFVNTENITTRISQKFLQILDVHLFNILLFLVHLKII